MLVFHLFPSIGAAQKFACDVRQVHKMRADAYRRAMPDATSMPMFSENIVVVEPPPPYPGQDEDAVLSEDQELIDLICAEAQAHGGVQIVPA